MLKSVDFETNALVRQLIFYDDNSEPHRIQTMEDPGLAAGNCFDVTTTILQSKLLGPEAEMVVVQTVDEHDDWWHVAVAVPDELGECLVIDYTARQFSADFTFPLVLQYDIWVDMIEEYAGKGSLIAVP